MTSRIALWGAASLDNLGDRLIALVTERGLRSRLAGAEFTRFCPWSRGGEVTRLCFDAAGRWPYADEFDAVVLAGGGIFGGPPFKHPIMQLFCFGSRPAEFAPHIFTAWNAVGLADDTWTDDRPRWTGYLRGLRSRLNYCSVRSEDTAVRIGGGGTPPTHVVPDSVYALPPVAAPRRGARTRPRLGVALGSPFHSQRFMLTVGIEVLTGSCPFDPSICLEPRDAVNTGLPDEERDRQRALLSRAVAVLNRMRHSVDIDFFGFGAMYGDRDVAKALSEAVPGSSCTILAADGDYDAVQSFIASYDALVVSRYHAAILAHRASRPFVAIDPHWSYRTQSSKLFQLTRRIRRSQLYWRGEGSEQEATAALSRMIEAILTGGPSTEGVAYEELHREAADNLDRLASGLREHDRARASIA